MKAAPMVSIARRSNSKAVIAVVSLPVIANRGVTGDRDPLVEHAALARTAVSPLRAGAALAV
jgi:hypothetical protein